MKIVIIILGVFWSFSMFAKEIHVSKTFKMSIPLKIKSEVEMLSLRSKLYGVNEAPNSSQILVMHAKPKTYANKFSVERYWKESRQQTKSFDKNEKDLGCTRNTARFFQCTRDVRQDGRNSSETIFWNTKKDLVLIRVSSNSFAESRKIMNQIKVSPDSRIPAAVKK